MKIKKLTNEAMRVPLVQTKRPLKECQYDDDVSNIENAFNIDIASYIAPDAPITSAPLFIICDQGIFGIENMTLHELVELIRETKFEAIEIESLPSELFEKYYPKRKSTAS